MKTPIANLHDFAALDPFFEIIVQGMEGFVEPGHFFDLMAEDVVTEYVITVPGYPARVAGRQAPAELYREWPTADVSNIYSIGCVGGLEQRTAGLGGNGAGACR